MSYLYILEINPLSVASFAAYFLPFWGFVFFILLIISFAVQNAGEDVEKRESYYTIGGNINWYNHYGEQYGDSLTN